MPAGLPWLSIPHNLKFGCRNLAFMNQFSRLPKKNLIVIQKKRIFRIAGVIGKTDQAKKEARLAVENGFHAVLLSLAAFKEASNEEILEHCKAVADEVPIIGFYLQPAVGG